MEAAPQAGLHVENPVFEDEGHGFCKGENRITAAEAYVDFLNRFLGRAATRFRAVLTVAGLALVACSGRSKIDESLRAELLQIQEEDQRYRSGLGALMQRPGAVDSLVES